MTLNSVNSDITIAYENLLRKTCLHNQLTDFDVFIFEEKISFRHSRHVYLKRVINNKNKHSDICSLHILGGFKSIKCFAYDVVLVS